MSSRSVSVLRHVVLLLTAVFLCLQAPAIASEEELETMWGPETFVRGKGAPVTEVREFSIEGFEAPFILHLRNGTENGDDRVSSAWVYLNGVLLFQPSDFSQQTYELEAEVTLTNPSLLSVQLASNPGGVVSVWIEGNLDSWSKEVGPAGGTFEFPNGLILEFPVGALNDFTTIEIQDQPCDIVDLIIDGQNELFSSHDINCLGAFRALPSGLEFNQPITARLPILPPAAGGGLLLLDIDLDRNRYEFTPSLVHFTLDTGMAVFPMGHFSVPGVATPDPCRSPEECGCRFCDTYDPARCAEWDPIMPPCCQLRVEEMGPNCPCDIQSCCKITEVISESTMTDDQAGQDECLIVTVTGVTRFPYCIDENGKPVVELDSQLAPSDECPDHSALDLEIHPERPTIHICKEQDFRADVVLTDLNGHVLRRQEDFLALWSSSNEEVAKLIDPEQGKFKGVSPGDASIVAKTVDSRYDAITRIDVEEYPQMEIESVGQSGGTAQNPEVKIFEEIKLNASVGASVGEGLCANTGECSAKSQECGDQTCRALEFTSRHELVEVIDQAKGTVRGLCPGFDVIDGTFTYCNQVFKGGIIVYVDSLQPMTVSAENPSDGTADAPRIRLGERLHLKATIPGFCGEQGQPTCEERVQSCETHGISCSLEWMTSGDKIEVNGETGEVRGLKPGSQTATARLIWCSTELTDSIEVEVKEAEVHVRAKYNDCDWNASYCEFPQTDGGIVFLTVEAWVDGAEGPIREGISIRAHPRIGVAQPAYGCCERGDPVCAEVYCCTPYYPGCQGYTDQTGLFHTDIGQLSHTRPFVGVEIEAFYGSKEAHMTLWAVSRDICYQFPYAAESTASGFRVDSTYQGVQNEYSTAEVSFVPKLGGLSGFAECRSSIGKSISGATASAGGFWWDTFVVIPDDLRILDEHFGTPVSMTMSLSNSGFVEADGSGNGGTGMARGGASVGTPSVPVVHSQSKQHFSWKVSPEPIDDKPTSYLHSANYNNLALGYTSYLRAFGNLTCTSSVTPECLEWRDVSPYDCIAWATVTAQSTVNFSVLWQGVGQVKVAVTGGAPVDLPAFKVFSCSGVLDR